MPSEKVNIRQIVTKWHELHKLMSPITSALYVSKWHFWQMCLWFMQLVRTQKGSFHCWLTNGS